MPAAAAARLPPRPADLTLFTITAMRRLRAACAASPLMRWMNSCARQAVPSQRGGVEAASQLPTLCSRVAPSAHPALAGHQAMGRRRLGSHGRAARLLTMIRWVAGGGAARKCWWSTSRSSRLSTHAIQCHIFICSRRLRLITNSCFGCVSTLIASKLLLLWQTTKCSH